MRRATDKSPQLVSVSPGTTARNGNKVAGIIWKVERTLTRSDCDGCGLADISALLNLERSDFPITAG